MAQTNFVVHNGLTVGPTTIDAASGNIAIPVGGTSADFYSISYPGYVQTPSVNSTALTINVALNAPDVAAEVYERVLIVEDIVADYIKRKL